MDSGMGHRELTFFKDNPTPVNDINFYTPMNNDTDFDANIALLSELFPDLPPEIILNSFLQQNCNIDDAIHLLLHSQIDPVISSAFDHLLKTFPDVEIEAIEAFLLTQETQSDYETITKEFMKQMNSNIRIANSPRDRPLKMNLADFGALFKSSNEKASFNYTRSNSRSQRNDFSFICKTFIIIFEQLL